MEAKRAMSKRFIRTRVRSGLGSGGKKVEGQRTKKGSRWGERRVGCIPCVSSLSECAYNTISKESQRFGLKNYGWATGTPQDDFKNHSKVEYF